MNIKDVFELVAVLHDVKAEVIKLEVENNCLRKENLFLRSIVVDSNKIKEKINE